MTTSSNYYTSKITGNINGTVYIIEFSQPLGNLQNNLGQARYYVGWCKAGEEQRRLNEHRTGRGASITRAAAEKGIQMTIVATMNGTRHDERRIKNQRNTPRLVAQLRKAGKTNY